MYYVVKIGRQPGIYESWTEAEKHVTGYSGAKYKSFKTRTEAEAWLSDDSKVKQVKPTVCTGIELPAQCKANGVTHNSRLPFSLAVPAKREPVALSVQRHAGNTYVLPEQKGVGLEFSVSGIVNKGEIEKEEPEHAKPLNKESVFKYDCRKLNIHNIIYAITENTTKILPDTWTDYDGCLYIFTDGSYKKSTNKAGSGVFFGESGVSIKLPDGFTNNQAELIGILYALQQIKLNTSQLSTCAKHVIVISDSMYCINTVTKWMKAWEKNNWQKANGEPILNPELIQAINILWQTINKTKSESNLNGKVKFEHQNSHTTAPIAKQSREYMLWSGNHIADQLATN